VGWGKLENASVEHLLAAQMVLLEYWIIKYSIHFVAYNSPPQLCFNSLQLVHYAVLLFYCILLLEVKS
jgi:hypothetical protein